MRNPISTGIALALVLFAGNAWAGVDVAWSEFNLVDASGVPANSKHAYYFKGILSAYLVTSGGGFSFSEGFYSTTNVTVINKYWAAGKGTWDASRNTAQELLQIQHDGGTDSLNASFKCNGDPWITNQSCVVIKVLFNSTASTGIHDWPGLVKHYGRPLSVHVVTLAKATELSKQHKTASAPPPPPPAKHQTTMTAKPPTGIALRQPGQVASHLPASPLQRAAPGTSRFSGKPVARIGPADLTSGASLVIGGMHTGWNRTVTLKAAAAAARNRNGSGACQFRIRHAVRNVGRSSSGAFDGVWRNSAWRGTTRSHWPPLAPGKQLDETDLVSLKPGMNKLSFQIDPFRRLEENNRANNGATLVVNLTGDCGSSAAHVRAVRAKPVAHVPLPPAKRLQLPSR